MFILEKMFRLQFKEYDDPATQMTGNNMLMRRITRYMNISGTLYAGTCVPYAAASLFLMLLGLISGVGSPLIAVLDGLIIKGGVLVLGFSGCMKHEMKYSWAAAGAQLLSMPFSGYTYFDNFFGVVGIDVNALLLVLYIALAVINTVCSKQYRILEDETGFPTFNQIFEEQKKQRREFEERDPFAEQMKRYQKNSSSDMISLDMEYRSTDSGGEKSGQSGGMDEI